MRLHEFIERNKNIDRKRLVPAKAFRSIRIIGQARLTDFDSVERARIREIQGN